MHSTVQKLLLCVVVLYCLIITVRSTKVKHCSGNKPFPLDVRVYGCEASPCDIIKGKDIIFEIHFVAHKDLTKGTTLVKATVLGFTIPYVLPDKVRDVCSNLMFGAYCPLYPTEDVTYLFVFPIGNYPEIAVKVEIYIVDQDKNVAACYVCDIKVKKGNNGDNNGTTVYQLDWKV